MVAAEAAPTMIVVDMEEEEDPTGMIAAAIKHVSVTEERGKELLTTTLQISAFLSFFCYEAWLVGWRSLSVCRFTLVRSFGYL